MTTKPRLSPGSIQASNDKPTNLLLKVPCNGIVQDSLIIEKLLEPF